MDKNKPEQDNAASSSKKENAYSGLEQKKTYSLLTAFGIVIFTVAGEYIFRHFVMFWFPAIGNLNVNDMISLFFAYLLIAGGIGTAYELIGGMNGWRYNRA